MLISFIFGSDFITIATAGNASDFGDILVGQEGPTGVSDGNRGVFAGGKAPTASDTIEFVAISVAGNATDFGDLTAISEGGSSGGNQSRVVHKHGIKAGGSWPSGHSNVIDYFAPATTGNATDFGDMLIASNARYKGECAGTDVEARGDCTNCKGGRSPWPTTPGSRVTKAD